MPAKITIDGLSNTTLDGVVERIHPQKITLNDGSQAYQVDVVAETLKNVGKLGQTGHVFIQSIAREDSMLVPVWAVVGHQYVWLIEQGQPKLQKVNVGNIHGDEVEISGLDSPNQKVILNPKSIADKKYKIL
jgi:hypothetical protein